MNHVGIFKGYTYQWCSDSALTIPESHKILLDFHAQGRIDLMLLNDVETGELFENVKDGKIEYEYRGFFKRVINNLKG